MQIQNIDRQACNNHFYLARADTKDKDKTDTKNETEEFPFLHSCNSFEDLGIKKAERRNERHQQKRKNRKVRFQGRPTRYLNGLVEKKSAKMDGPDDVTMLLH